MNFKNQFRIFIKKAFSPTLGMNIYKSYLLKVEMYSNSNRTSLNLSKKCPSL